MGIPTLGITEMSKNKYRVDDTVNPYPSIDTMFPNLNSNLLQQRPTGAMQGAGRFYNPYSNSINYNSPNNTMQNNYESLYSPAAFEPSPVYQMGSLLASTNNPIFSFIGNDMMSSSPQGSYTFTPTTNTQGK